MKSLHVEMLMGHNIGLAANYYRPTEEELMDYYAKAVADLTILEIVKGPSLAKLEALEKESVELRKELQEIKEEVKLLGMKLGNKETTVI